MTNKLFGSLTAEILRDGEVLQRIPADKLNERETLRRNLETLTRHELYAIAQTHHLLSNARFIDLICKDAPIEVVRELLGGFEPSDADQCAKVGGGADGLV